MANTMKKQTITRKPSQADLYKLDRHHHDGSDLSAVERQIKSQNQKEKQQLQNSLKPAQTEPEKEQSTESALQNALKAVIAQAKTPALKTANTRNKGFVILTDENNEIVGRASLNRKGWYVELGYLQDGLDLDSFVVIDDQCFYLKKALSTTKIADHVASKLDHDVFGDRYILKTYTLGRFSIKEKVYKQINLDSCDGSGNRIIKRYQLLDSGNCLHTFVKFDDAKTAIFAAYNAVTPRHA